MNTEREIEISSVHNRTYKELLFLLTGRGMKKSGQSIIAGAKTVPELLLQKPNIISAWIASPKHGSAPLELPAAVSRYRLNSLLFNKLDINGTGFPLLVIDRPAMEQYDDSLPGRGAILFVPFQDPANVGAVIRSAVAFDVSSVVLLKESANPYHHKSLRAAGTALFHSRLLEGPSITDLHDLRLPLIALDSGGQPIHTFTFPDQFILLPGMEGGGLPPDIAPDHIISIPMSPSVESLNAAVSVSVALYEWKRQTIVESSS